ncbi:MAG: immune inhibitor A [Saprospiraceae bacterium]|nr:immune inhibitor A [Candidatus Vicinibacter proximus]
MRSQFIRLLLFVFVLPTLSIGQHDWHKIKISLEGKTIRDLQYTGLAFDHGQYEPGISFTGDFTHEEMEKLEKAGFKLEIVANKILIQPRTPVSCDSISDGGPVFKLPSNYPYGSMNGFPNLNELYESLDLMQELYPKLITVRKSVGNFRTEEGNLIYYVKISDNPDLDESEPEILYTALHHAREPVSMSQMLYFMWHLLENYGQDQEITKLVNSRAMYFIPCVNPDGYLYNQKTNPAGQGFWRKNRKEDTDGVGVDLNRNYGYQWGYNDTGSSPLWGSETFRGENAFSEIETKAIRQFCIDHEFQIALNYHSHGDLLIVPWGYSSLNTVDSSLFSAMATQYTRYNRFRVGSSFSTLNYEVNGVSDDWMYGDVVSKNKIFAFTPEVGYNFWPERKDILRINQSTQFMNKMAAWNAGACAEMKDHSPEVLAVDQGSLNVFVQRTGVAQAAIHVVCSSDHPNHVFIQNIIPFVLEPGAGYMVPIEYTLGPGLSRGEVINFTIKLTTGDYEQTIQARKVYWGNPAWEEKCLDQNQWMSPNNNPLVITTESYTSAPGSFTDSPNKKLTPGREYRMRTTVPIDLRNAASAFLSLQAKWDLNPESDFAQVQISTDGISFEPICGRYTVRGGNFQDLDNPVYSGSQKNWIAEWIDLKKYLGRSIYLQIFVNTNYSEIPYDGFYVDDIKLFTSFYTSNHESERSLIHVYPQPAHAYLEIRSEDILPAKLNLSQLDGKTLEMPLKHLGSGHWRMDVAGLQPGVYLLHYVNAQGHQEIQKISIQ